MKSFYIIGVHWKIQFLGGVHEKRIYKGGIGGLVKKWGGVFLRGRGWYPNAHYEYKLFQKPNKIISKNNSTPNFVQNK